MHRGDGLFASSIVPDCTRAGVVGLGDVVAVTRQAVPANFANDRRSTTLCAFVLLLVPQ